MSRYLRYICLIGIILFPCSLGATGPYTVTSNDLSVRTQKRENILSDMLVSFGSFVTKHPLDIVIDNLLVEPRGKLHGSNISLSAQVSKDGEFVKLFVHEFGHFVDIFALNGFGVDDTSTLFYDISWSDTKTKKANEGIGSFVSGYAQTNKYEDFAETFTFYIFHNEDFADRAMRNDSLRKKYLFMSEHVFPKGDFIGTSFGLSKIPVYLWDTTKLPISVQKYLYFIKKAI